MTQTIRYSIPNGVIFIEDIGGAMPPEPFTGETIQWTSECVAVICKHEIDGEMEIVLGKIADVAPNNEPNFHGSIETPSGKLMIAKVPGEAILATTVFRKNTVVSVWCSHPGRPEKVVVGWA